MGALHEGHLALVARARERCAALGASVFVNPLQFGAGEDLARYPRDIERDCAQLTAAGVDVLFVPDAGEMYPAGFAAAVDVGPLGDVFEGALRPGHFRGVATVIAKLLNIVRPDTLILGQKDAQQIAVVRRLVADLDFGVAIDIAPTVREPDGLAMSSRNAYLDRAQRAQAPSLYRALVATRDALERGEPKREATAAGRAALSASAQLDYLDLVDAQTFDTLEEPRESAIIVAAARFGATRLIDNLWLRRPSTSSG